MAEFDFARGEFLSEQSISDIVFEAEEANDLPDETPVHQPILEYAMEPEEYLDLLVCQRLSQRKS